jgi:hypothetical protein
MAHQSIPRHSHASAAVVHPSLHGGGRRVWSRCVRGLMLLALLAGLLPAAPSAVWAQSTLIVTTTVDKDDGSLNSSRGISLREAIVYAQNGTRIILPPGTYNLTLTGVGDVTGVRGDLDVIDKAITLEGAGAATTRIVASFPGGAREFDRVLDVHPGARLTIADVTISGGSTTGSGGGVRNRGVLEANRIVVSSSSSGGATDGTLEDDRGGGIYTGPDAQLTLRDSEIRGNTARRFGGGVFVDLGATATILNTTIADNVAVHANGGGLANQGTVTLTNSTISGNSANGNGGGIYNASSGLLTARNATISNNTANAYAAGNGDAGGAYNDSRTVGALTFRNSIIAGNQDLRSIDADPAESIYPDLHARFPNTIVGNSKNLIGSRDGIAGSLTIGTLGQGDLVTPAIGLSPLGNYNSAVRVHLLLPNSPAVDAGDPLVCINAPVSNRDQRGLTRPIDGTGNGTAVCDIGAVELRPAIVVADGATPIPNEGSVNFGATPRGTPLMRTLTIRNIGEAPLLIDAASLTLPDGFGIGSGFAETRILPGDATTLGLVFTAASLGASSGMLSFGTSAPELATFSMTLSATATPQPATIAVLDGTTTLAEGALVDFGATALNTPVDRSFTIRNVGDRTVTIGAITPPDGFSIQAGPGDPTLSPGEATTLQVRFLAAARGVTIGPLTIASNAVGSPVRIGLSGAVGGVVEERLAVLDITTLDLVAEGSTVAMGSTSVGTPLDRTFRVSNVSADEVIIAAPITTPAGFSLAEPFGTTTLASGGSVDITIRADAERIGIPNGVVTIMTNAPTDADFSFSVSATVAAAPPRVVVSTGDAGLANGDNVSFGATTIGAPVTRTFTIRNTGGSNLTLGAATVPTGYTLETPFNSTVAPGATTTLVVRLAATSVGVYEGALSFTTNDPAADTFRIAVNGTVTNRPPQLLIAIDERDVAGGATIDVGTTPGGERLRATVTIRNTGGSPLALNAIVLPPGFSRDPSVTPAETVPPGGSTSFILVLDAVEEGASAGQVTIRTNDPLVRDFRFRVSGVVGLRITYLLLIGR